MKTPICPCSDIPEGDAKGFEINGLAFFILQRNNTFYAYQNTCPHIGTPLNWTPNNFLDSEGEFIQCATHGALFLKDSGECVSGPCLGQHLTTIPIENENDYLFLLS